MKPEEIIEARDRLVRHLPDPAQIVRGTLLKRVIRHRRGY